MRMFGFEITRPNQLEGANPSFAPKEIDDGAVTVQATGASYGTYVDLDGVVRTEAELVSKYRGMAEQPEIDAAITEITDEAINIDDEGEIVKLNLDNLDKMNIPEKVQKVIEEEFRHILRLFEFGTHGYDIFRRFYTDGRLNYHVILDPKSPKDGIKELRYIDPRKIRKVREVQKQRVRTDDPGSDVAITKTVNEYYIYNEKGFGLTKATGNPMGGAGGMKIARDSVIQVTSGVMDPSGSIVYSWLQPAIKPINALRALEDATVIYRLARAPERRVWYIDVGNLPKMKAEQYLRDIMVKHKNRLVYDATTGEVRDDRKFMTMLEDYWLPRREGGRGTEIDTLPAGQNLGQMDDVLYFQKRLMKSLNVPITRLDSENTFNVGQSSQITREEIKFAKFIQRLRARFASLFLEALERQLVLKNIMSYDDWRAIRQDIRFDFTKDNYFAELKELEILTNRMNVATQMQTFIGTVFTLDDMRKGVFKLTDEQIKEKMPKFLEDAAFMAQVEEIKTPQEPEPPMDGPTGD